MLVFVPGGVQRVICSRALPALLFPCTPVHEADGQGVGLQSVLQGTEHRGSALEFPESWTTQLTFLTQKAVLIFVLKVIFKCWNLFLSLFIEKTKWEEVRSSSSMVYGLLSKHLEQPRWARPDSGTPNPNTCAITCHLPGYATSGSWIPNREAGTWSSHSDKGCRHPK